MAELVLPSFAKVNLTLRVLGKRPDGYHEVFTIFQTISLHDEIGFSVSEDTILECDDSSIPTDDSNLILRAADALRRKTGSSAGVTVKLRKRIPSPGGLGGGSSNAAVTLMALSRLWNLGLSVGELAEIGSTLGSDVPFFVHGGTALGTGRGTDIDPVDDCPIKEMVVVSPEIGISTPEAYSALGFRDLTKKNPKRILEHYRKEAKALYTGGFEFVNDFERTVFGKYPEVEFAAEALQAAGAQIVSLSGSGPSLFGVFESAGRAQSAVESLSRTGFARCFAVQAVSRESYRERLGLE